MKILLIGEYSGVHNNLKKGLKALGHEVTLAADGDGHKKYRYDFKISPFKGKLLALLNLLYMVINFNKFVGYDVIQFINPGVLPYYLYYFGIPQLLFLLNKKKVYYVCGTDPAFLNSQKLFNYFPLDDPNSIDYPQYNWAYFNYYRWFINKIDVIVPSMYSYYVGYSWNTKLSKLIPLPGSGGNIKQNTKIHSQKIKVLFGVLRYDFKGAKFIYEALSRLENEFGNIVEITIVEKLSHNEYLQILKNHDILIDQCKSYDYGMNAIIGMENGLIVLSGNEKKSNEFLGYYNMENPVINITPNTNQIYDVIKSLILLEPSYLNELKNSSLSWVNKVHNLKNISDSFIELYSAQIS